MSNFVHNLTQRLIQICFWSSNVFSQRRISCCLLVCLFCCSVKINQDLTFGVESSHLNLKLPLAPFKSVFHFMRLPFFQMEQFWKQKVLSAPNAQLDIEISNQFTIFLKHFCYCNPMTSHIQFILQGFLVESISVRLKLFSSTKESPRYAVGKQPGYFLQFLFLVILSRVLSKNKFLEIKSWVWVLVCLLIFILIYGSVYFYSSLILFNLNQTAEPFMGTTRTIHFYLQTLAIRTSVRVSLILYHFFLTCYVLYWVQDKGKLVLV